MRSLRWLLSLGLATLVGAGCGNGADEAAVTDDPTVVESPGESPSDTPGEDGVPATAGDDVPAVLAFSAPTLDGGTLEGAELAGRPVVFWFWSPH